MTIARILHFMQWSFRMPLRRHVPTWIESEEPIVTPSGVHFGPRYLLKERERLYDEGKARGFYELSGEK